MKWAMITYRAAWQDDPAKLEELLRRLAGERDWPTDRVQTMLSKGSNWHYHTGSAPPSDWRKANFDIEPWPFGPAPLGYGEADIATEIPAGEADDKWASAFFVTDFSVPDETNFEQLRVKVRSDDGIVISLNGVEVHRQHLPTNADVTWKTYATREVGGIEEELYYVTEIDPSFLRPHNRLSVQVHQCNGKSSDLIFDLTLEGVLK